MGEDEAGAGPEPRSVRSETHRGLLCCCGGGSIQGSDFLRGKRREQETVRSCSQWFEGRGGGCSRNFPAIALGHPRHFSVLSPALSQVRSQAACSRACAGPSLDRVPVRRLCSQKFRPNRHETAHTISNHHALPGGCPSFAARQICFFRSFQDISPNRPRMRPGRHLAFQGRFPHYPALRGRGRVLPLLRDA
ncbi:hypothetical protein BV25DRAFT_793876 [Artomyces pyxidatus]|uniref:Uncharacterized protein n=1 Tax=Artomyces pyxidatus TaxID=48021 RepID=A0ACB8SZ30_9AGAM|nr:hypothetical protein BV25DRAFT_793876 [Artomyces pyxidatus]